MDCNSNPVPFGLAARTQRAPWGEQLLLGALFGLALLLDMMAEAPYLGAKTPLYPFTLVAAILVALVLLLLLGVTPGMAAMRALGGAWQRRGLMLLGLLLALMTIRFMGGVPSAPVRLLFLGFGIVFLALFWRNPQSLLWFFVLAIGYSVAQRIRFFNIVPVRPEFSDILPLLLMAGKNFLAGQPVYVVYSMPWKLPMAYLPVTWLSYVPAIAAGIDVRWTNLLYELGIAVIFLSLVYPMRREPAVNVPLAFGALIFLAPTAIYWDAFTAHQAWWFWLALAVRLLLARRWVWFSAAAGVSLAASQLMLVVLPVFLVYLARAVTVRRAAFYAAALGAVALAILLPFAWRNPAGFVNDSVFFYTNLENYGRVMWDANRRVLNVVGFGGEAWLWGAQNSLKYIQGATIFFMAALYGLLFCNSAANALRVGAVTLGLFLLVSPIIWEYYYQALLWLLLFYVAARAVQSSLPG